MAHHYQKRWVFTWNANDDGSLPDRQQLERYLNEITTQGVFQKEKGQGTGRLHYQGRFELKGPRIGKKQLLTMFKELGSTTNLTFSPERLYDSSNYCVKEETRVEGPWFVGLGAYKHKRNQMNITLRPWQQTLLNELNSPLGETFRQRKVLWIQDPAGGSGKSTFLKYLGLKKDGLKFKKLPLDKPDRIRLMVCKIVQKEDVDAFVFDFTRTLDEDTSIRSLFQIVEEIKNGHIVSAMYGNPMEVFIPNPLVIIFTNEDISQYYNYLSKDRWQLYEIMEQKLCRLKEIEPHNRHTRYETIDEKRKKD